jgi:hypothetical protein
MQSESSSVGRALASQAKGRGFESRFSLTKKDLLLQKVFFYQNRF